MNIAASLPLTLHCNSCAEELKKNAFKTTCDHVFCNSCAHTFRQRCFVCECHTSLLEFQVVGAPVPDDQLVDVKATLYAVSAANGVKFVDNYVAEIHNFERTQLVLGTNRQQVSAQKTQRDAEERDRVMMEKELQYNQMIDSMNLKLDQAQSQLQNQQRAMNDMQLALEDRARQADNWKVMYEQLKSGVNPGSGNPGLTQQTNMVSPPFSAMPPPLPSSSNARLGGGGSANAFRAATVGQPQVVMSSSSGKDSSNKFSNGFRNSSGFVGGGNEHDYGAGSASNSSNRFGRERSESFASSASTSFSTHSTPLRSAQAGFTPQTNYLPRSDTSSSSRFSNPIVSTSSSSARPQTRQGGGGFAGLGEYRPASTTQSFMQRSATHTPLTAPTVRTSYFSNSAVRAMSPAINGNPLRGGTVM